MNVGLIKNISCCKFEAGLIKKDQIVSRSWTDENIK